MKKGSVKLSNKVLKIIGLIVVILIVLSAIMCISGVLFTKSINNESNESTNTTIDTKGIEEDKKDFTKTKNSFKNKEFEFKILKIDKNYKKEYMFKKNKDYKVVKIDIEIKNLSKKDIYVSEFIAKSNDKMLERNFSSDNDINISGKVLPNSTISGSVAFEIPKEAKNMSLIYDYGFWQDKKLSFNIDVKQ